MTRRGEANVFAHRHQEYILVDEKEVNTQRDALLCRYKFTWHRHDCQQFPSCLLLRVVPLHFDDQRAPNLPHDLGISQRDVATFDCIRAQGCVKVRLRWTLQHLIQFPCFRSTFNLSFGEHFHVLFHRLHKCRPRLAVRSFQDVQPRRMLDKTKVCEPIISMMDYEGLVFLATIGDTIDVV